MLAWRGPHQMPPKLSNNNENLYNVDNTYIVDGGTGLARHDIFSLSDREIFWERMLGTFNQHLPMILSNNYLHQSKPTSLHDTGMGVIP